LLKVPQPELSFTQPTTETGLPETKKKECIVLGIGNPLLKDDRVGIDVVEALEASHTPVATEILYSVGFEVLDKILGYQKAIIVDACQLGLDPGTIIEVTPEALFASDRLVNSHAITLGATLRTGQMVLGDEIPESITIILIEAADITHFSRKCTPVVAKAAMEVVNRIQVAVSKKS